jgi:hypothetical protein
MGKKTGSSPRLAVSKKEDFALRGEKGRLWKTKEDVGGSSKSKKRKI